jgi:hypothetical protein
MLDLWIASASDSPHKPTPKLAFLQTNLQTKIDIIP